MWDATLEYLVESENKTYAKIVDSASWGNYYWTSFSYKNISGITVTKSANSATLIPTGATDRNTACNIYDLGGNVYEWTQEGSSTYSRSMNGGNYKISGSDYPVSKRLYFYPYYSDSHYRLPSYTLC